jgi:MFS family permease
MRVPASTLAPLHTPDPTAAVEHASITSNIRAILREMQEGLVFILRTRLLLVLITLGLVAMFGAGAINALDIVFAYQRLQATPALYGYLSAAGGLGALAGAICGSLIARRVGSRYLTAGSMTALGIGLIVYALQTHFLVAVIVVFILCMPQGTLNIGLAPLFLLATPNHLIGRVMALFNTVSYGASLLSIALAGYLGQFIPAYLLLLGGGVLITVAGLFGWFALPTAPTNAPDRANADQVITNPVIE